jgi:hypothetical protein
VKTLAKRIEHKMQVGQWKHRAVYEQELKRRDGLCADGLRKCPYFRLTASFAQDASKFPRAGGKLTAFTELKLSNSKPSL